MNPFYDKHYIWDYLPKWKHPTFSHDFARLQEAGLYHVIYSGNRIAKILIPSGGGGDVLESTTHEIAHMIDFVLRGQSERLYHQNYGMSFTKKLKNPKRALDREIDVIAIQGKIFNLCGFNKSDSMDALNQIMEGLAGLDAFYPLYRYNVKGMIARQDSYNKKRCKEQYDAINPVTIKQAYSMVLETIDKKCLKSLRMSV